MLSVQVKRHNHLKIGQYHQHLTELLDPELTPLEYMVSFPQSMMQFDTHLDTYCVLNTHKYASCLLPLF